MNKEEKYPYVLVYFGGKVMYFPYEEAQDYSNYAFPDSSIIYLTDEELEQKEQELENENKK